MLLFYKTHLVVMGLFICKVFGMKVIDKSLLLMFIHLVIWSGREVYDLR